MAAKYHDSATGSSDFCHYFTLAKCLTKKVKWRLQIAQIYIWNLQLVMYRVTNSNLIQPRVCSDPNCERESVEYLAPSVGDMHSYR